MKKVIQCIFLSTIIFSFSIQVNAENEKPNDPIKIQYESVGFTTPEKAIKEFQSLYQQKLNINEDTLNGIPFKITHRFGAFDKSIDQYLSLIYLNEQSKAMFKIMVFPKKNEIPLSKNELIDKLNNGIPFSYKKEQNFFIFRFKTENYAYILSSNYLGENQNMEKKFFIQMAEKITNTDQN